MGVTWLIKRERMGGACRVTRETGETHGRRKADLDLGGDVVWGVGDLKKKVSLEVNLWITTGSER